MQRPDSYSDQAIIAWLEAQPRHLGYSEVAAAYVAQFGKSRTLNHQALWRARLILPIIRSTPHGSRERAALIDQIAGEPIPDWHHGVRWVGTTTLYKWIARYDAKGLSGLIRKPRSDAAQPRVHLSRTWDQAMHKNGMPEAKITEIARALQERLRRLWITNEPRRVRMDAVFVLMSLTVSAGVVMPEGELFRTCAVSKRLVDNERPPSLRRSRPRALPAIGATPPAAAQLFLPPDVTTPQPAPAVDPDAEWCLLVLRPGVQGGGSAVPAAFGKWLGRQFKVSSVHFVTADAADRVTSSLRITPAEPQDRIAR